MSELVKKKKKVSTNIKARQLYWGRYFEPQKSFKEDIYSRNIRAMTQYQQTIY